jgi:nucleoside-diphosphate-sugar epimerase
MAKLVFGCGYLGRRVAQRWRAAGHAVFAVTRSAERAAEFQAEGWQPIIADVLRPESLRELPAAETVLFAVGHDRNGGHALREVYVDGLRNVLAALPHATKRLIYISSTGVYGQNNGQWVDEDSPCEPSREGGRVCLEAERMLLAHEWGRRSIVLRLAGIYGPGRIPRLQELQCSEPIAAPAAGFLNLIHVEDAVAAVRAVESHSAAPRLFNVADGHPVIRSEYYQELARQAGFPAPRFIEAEKSSHAFQRAATDKRVRAARLIDEVGWRLQFPTYREGLAAILRFDTGP